MKILTLIPILLSGLFGCYLTRLHCRFWGDRVAEFTGYFFSVFVVPGLIFTLIVIPILLLEKIFLPKTISKHIFKSSWLWVILGMAVTYLPVIIYIVG